MYSTDSSDRYRRISSYTTTTLPSLTVLSTVLFPAALFGSTFSSTDTGSNSASQDKAASIARLAMPLLCSEDRTQYPRFHSAIPERVTLSNPKSPRTASPQRSNKYPMVHTTYSSSPLSFIKEIGQLRLNILLWEKSKAWLC
ncbi:MAG: hypothetical protein Ct9H90mP14_4040 [Methanobacteriota archaeon]|nr:MAG: hypothetical protein Ct9H90mP14_4040 [Euryarchaeota archaeon]